MAEWAARRGWDSVVVGGGLVGSSIAYHLARLGAHTLLLQAGDLGGGTSTACAGRAQVGETHLKPLNLRLVREGFARLGTLEEERGYRFEWRRQDYLCLIETAAQWDDWSKRAAVLTAAGLPGQMLDVSVNFCPKMYHLFSAGMYHR